MRSSFRYLVLTVLSALVMAFGSFSSDAVADDGRAALKLAPKETAGVIAINVERLKGSPLYKTAMTLLSADPSFKKGLQEAKDKAGVDFEKDLNGVVILMPANVSSGQMLVVASGTFDQAKITAFAKSEGAVEEKVGGQVMLKESGGKGAVAFAGGHVLFGTVEMVKSALTAGGALGADITKLTGAVDSSKDLWVAMSVPAELKAMSPELKDLNDVTASLDLSSGLILKLAVGTTSADAAKKLVEMANAGIAQAAKDPSLAGMGLAGPVTRAKVTASGATINVDFDVTSAELDTLQKMLGGMMRP